MLLILPNINSIETNIKQNDYDIGLELEVEKKTLGWHITTTLTNNGNEWIYVEKEGYGDIGCTIYNDEDVAIWSTYDPDDGGSWQIGKGATYESFTIWTGKDMNGNKVEKGTYTVVGQSGYFNGNEYIPLETTEENIKLQINSNSLLQILFEIIYNLLHPFR